MRKGLIRFLNIALCLALVLSAVPKAEGYTAGEAYQRDLSTWIQNPQRREYVEMMLDYHVRNNRAVQNALLGGFAAVFLFDGCSDHLDDAELKDLSYYRVSGICVVLKLDSAGNVKMLYINDNASTIPDRPLEYGAWSLPEVGKVGPATVFDGTYQLYSVRHKGNYEALHVRTDYWDGTLDAVYMTPEGYTTYRANEINVHTRTSNHTSGVGMWSAGCPLVGDGDEWEFWKLINAVYYSTYDTFEVDNFVGTLTIDRNLLRTELYTLYKDPDAVDTFLGATREIQPETYLDECSGAEAYAESQTMQLVRQAQVMTLPCSNATDARSRVIAEVAEGQKVEIVGTICNPLGNWWYVVDWEGQQGYLYSGHVQEMGRFQKFWERLFG